MKNQNDVYELANGVKIPCIGFGSPSRFLHKAHRQVSPLGHAHHRCEGYIVSNVRRCGKAAEDNMPAQTSGRRKKKQALKEKYYVGFNIFKRA